LEDAEVCSLPFLTSLPNCSLPFPSSSSYSCSAALSCAPASDSSVAQKSDVPAGIYLTGGAVPSFEHMPHAPRGLDGSCKCDSCALRLSQTRSLPSRLPMSLVSLAIIYGFIISLPLAPCPYLPTVFAPHILFILCLLRVTADIKALVEAAAAAQVWSVIPLLSCHVFRNLCRKAYGRNLACCCVLTTLSTLVPAPSPVSSHKHFAQDLRQTVPQED
jgi:hypothetical protein